MALGVGKEAFSDFRNAKQISSQSHGLLNLFVFHFFLTLKYNGPDEIDSILFYPYV